MATKTSPRGSPRTPIPIPLKPGHVATEEAQWQYVVWFHLTHGHQGYMYPSHHPGFWEWWDTYYYAETRERDALKRELGIIKFNETRQFMSAWYNEAMAFSQIDKSILRQPNYTSGRETIQFIRCN